MESTNPRSVTKDPYGDPCKGTWCDDPSSCHVEGGCQYKSSAQEAREHMHSQKTLDTLIAISTPLKPSNPKDAIGSDKVPLHLWPETATALGALGLLDGMLKYGRGNFREIGVRASIYQDAAKRHLDYWFEGEDNDPDSGLPHLAHALACIAILVDSEAAGKLNDDRQVKGGFRALMTKLTPHVARLKLLHAGKTPKHYTIADNK